jgi:hypothetical protein
MSQSDRSAQNDGATLRALVHLWFEVASTHLLMWVANPTGMHSFQPHVHLYLADRYGRLAVAYGHRSGFRMAGRMADKARLHFELGGGDDPPPAAALALGGSRRQVRTDADAVSEAEPDESKVMRFVPKKPRSSVEQLGSDV